jgi:uncharacterized delta-60 repeat protein
MRKLSRTTLAAAIACSLALSSTAVAADGDLDTPFDYDGIANLPDGHLPKLAVQPDGKTVVVGEAPGGDTTIIVHRITTTGALDNSFGEGGTVVLQATGGLGMGDVALQPDGKIVVAATQTPSGNGDVTVFRLNGNGTPDAGFGTGGSTTFDFASGVDSRPTALAVQPDGAIVVGGDSRVGDSVDFGAARLTSGGSLDNSFSGDGVTTEDVGSPQNVVTDVVLQGGRIVLIGSTYGINGDLRVLGLKVDGTRDSSFGEANGLYSGAGGGGFPSNGIVTRDGGLLIGYVIPGLGWPTVQKLTPAGRSDNSFSGDGRLQYRDDGANGLHAVVSQTVDGKYALATTDHGALWTAKITPDGSNDDSWRSFGHHRYSSVTPWETSDVALGTDGNVLVGGYNGSGMAVARLLDSIPELSVHGGTALEGQVLPFAASLNKTSGFPVSFDFTTGEGSAASGLDFTGRSGRLTIPAGQTTVPIGVGTRLDRLFENDEAFRVELSNVAGAQVGDLLANGTIINVLRSGRCQNIVDGHKGTDILTGSSAGDLMIGRNDVDYLYGFDGADCIYGQRGGDFLDGGAGDDLVDGGGGNDQIKGGPGNDRLYGRTGRNRYDGGPGNDRIDSRNAVSEIVECGSGRDVVRADRRDRLRHCERVIY